MDAIRSFAILPVLGVHAGVPGFSAGWLGVDLFFCMSGFLITTLLIDESNRTGNINLKNFLVRRFLRLMPAYYLYIAGITVAIWLWRGSVRTNHGGWTPVEFTLSLWTYFVNFAPKGGIWNGQGVTVHLWSLAVEEQYYIFWPVCLWALLRVPRAMLPSAWLLFAAVFAYFLLLASNQQRDTMLFARGFSLFFSSAAAATLSSSRFQIAMSSLRAGTANVWLNMSFIFTALAFLASEFRCFSESQLRLYVLPFLVFIYVVSIARLWYTSVGGLWGYVLSRPGLIYFGKVSYGVYLYHEAIRTATWACTNWLTGVGPRPVIFVLRCFIYVSVSIAAASLSYEMYEKRFLVLKSKFT